MSMLSHSFTSRFQLNLGAFVLWLFICSALIGMSLGYEQWFITKTPLNLLLVALILVWIYPIRDRNYWSAWFIAFATGMAVEILGVQTGLIFGDYEYGDNLGLMVLDVPLLIGVNWAVLSFVTYAISRKLVRNALGQMMLGGFLMVLIDIPMEQLASRFDFWHWAGDHIPLQNYVAWLVTAFFLQWVLRRLVDRGNYVISSHIYLSQFVFFVLSYLILS